MKIRKLPLFPLVPFVPMAIVGGMITLELFMLRRLRKLACSLDELTHRQQVPIT